MKQEHEQSQVQEPEQIVIRPLSAAFRSCVKEIIARGGKPEIPIVSLPTLNEKIWGLRRKHLTVIGGRTSQGKTSLAMHLALDAAKQGLKVRYLSLEQDDEELSLRLFCNVAKIPMRQFIEQPGQFNAEMETFWNYLRKDLANFVVTYKLGASVGQLGALIADLEADVVVVDYVQAIKKLDVDKVESMNKYIMGFRELAVRQNFSGILLSQINREAEEGRGNKPNLWQLKGSGAIEEHADTVLLCHYRYFYTHAVQDIGKFTLVVAKQRQGETCELPLTFDPTTFSFKEGKSWIEVDKDSLGPDAKKINDLFDGQKVEVETGGPDEVASAQA